MGMGYGANFALVVEQDKLEEMNLDSWKNFVQTLDEKEVSLDEYATSTKYSNIMYNDSGEALEEAAMEDLDNLFRSFQEEFQEKTGVSIYMDYHSVEDEGDRYDDVSGMFFALSFDDVYQMTPEATALQEKTGFNMKFFVTFG